MFVNEEEQTEQSVRAILDPREQVAYHNMTLQLYESVAMILMLSRIGPGSKTFDKVIDILIEKVPYIPPQPDVGEIPGARQVQIQEQTTYPPEAIAFFKQVFGEDDWNSMTPEDQRKQVARLAKSYKDGAIKLSAGPGGLRTRAATADQKKIYKTLEKYKADPGKYITYIYDQIKRLIKMQYDARGYEYMIKENPDLKDTVKQKPKQDFEDRFYPTIADIMGDKSNFKQQTFDNYKNILVSSVAGEIAKIDLREQYEIVFDLNLLKEQKQLLNEGFFDMFGSWVKFILKTVLGDFSIPVSVKGNPREVEAFARAIQGEKRYINAIGKYGLNNKATYSSRAELARSIKGFERETGLMWPFN